jgi:hypothetical protein
MTETVNNALEMMWKQLKVQHLPSVTMQNHQNSQKQQKMFRPRSVPRILQIQRHATTTVSNHFTVTESLIDHSLQKHYKSMGHKTSRTNNPTNNLI